MKLLISLVLILTSTSTLAYTLQFSTILSRTADNHGRGLYYMERDVHLQNDKENFQLKEHWWIENSQKLRLEVSGKSNLKDKVRMTFIYNKNKRYYIGPNGKIQTSKASPDFIENYFLFRYSKRIHPQLLAEKIIPAHAIKPKVKAQRIEDITYESQDFIRLSRVGGSINYAFGEISSANDKQLNPGLWIEQDKFVIRKLRLKSGLTVSANKYLRYKKGLWYPKSQEITWDHNRATIRVLSIMSIARSKKNQFLLSPKSFSSKYAQKNSLLIPDHSLIRSFYTRLR